MARVKDKVAGLVVTSRLSAADFVPYPYGFGMDPQRPESIDLHEFKALAGAFAGLGTPLLLTSLGIPFWKPAYGRLSTCRSPGARFRKNTLSKAWSAISASRRNSSAASRSLLSSAGLLLAAPISSLMSRRPSSGPATRRSSARAGAPSLTLISPAT